MQVSVTFFETFNRADIRHTTATFPRSTKSCGRKLENPLDTPTHLLKPFRLTYLLFSGNSFASFKNDAAETARFALIFAFIDCSWRPGAYLQLLEDQWLSNSTLLQKNIVWDQSARYLRAGVRLFHAQNSFRSRFWPS